jgi:hypothetical protein
MVVVDKLQGDSIKIVTSILQKPLIGMLIEDVNTINVINDTAAAN